ncbi:MAG TPA: hypothetical protein PLX85_06030, partial [Dehalococcoidia bacterium]|nr:hypothetical protein [Dehalococcoidia bacterium]
RASNERRQWLIVVHKTLPVGQEVGYSFRWRRDEARGLNRSPGRRYPHLTIAELSGAFVFASNALKEDSVQLPGEADANRKLLERLETDVHRTDVVCDLSGITTIATTGRLKYVDVGERRLGAFNARRQDGFAPRKRGDQQVRIEKRLSDPAQGRH